MKQWTRANYQPAIPLGRDGRRVTASPEHIALSKNAAKDGMVLLKNERRTLPLQKGTRVALFGKATIDYVKGGGGSGDVTVPYIRNIHEGFCLVAGEDAVFAPTSDFYRTYVAKAYASGGVPGMIPEPELPDELLHQAAVFADAAVISISRFSGEGWDRKADFGTADNRGALDTGAATQMETVFPRGDFYLTDAERALMEKVCAAFDRVIVVLNVGGMVETAWLKANEKIGAVLMAWQGGMEGGLAAAELLMGMGNPSAKLADTFAAELRDYPFAERFFDSETYLDYTEDIYVGYRYFETIPGAKDQVVYPFGFGLSYTRFALLDPKVQGLSLMVTVRNEGDVAGREVVQAYFGAPQGKLGKPARQLLGYRKTRLLQPGEEEQVRIPFRVEDMASYDDLGKVRKSAWLLEAGEYQLYLGTDVRSAARVGSVTVADTVITRQLTPRLAPTDLKERMLADGTLEPLPTGNSNDPRFTALLPRMTPDEQGGTPPTRAYASIPFNHDKDRPHLSDVAEGKLSLDAFIAALSDEDLAYLLSGIPNRGVANTCGFGGNPHFGIPPLMTADGPAGLRIDAHVGVCTTAFPCSTMMACTWDPDLCYEVGAAGAQEVKENNISVWLTPGVCIHRNPLCGRNFEYYSEDPLLAGKQAAAMVRGIQSQRVAATPKHFALNNKESDRFECDSRASERAIREIYIRQFEIIVKEANPWAIMSSYNIVNGHRASENADLLTGILREEWGWTGMITTDWWTHGEHYKEVVAGNDLKMPKGHPGRLLRAMAEGLLTRQEMETCARHILTLMLRVD